MRMIPLLATVGLCLLPMVMGCATGGGAMGPGMSREGHTAPIGIDGGINYGFDQPKFTGELDSTTRRAAVIHGALAINLPGDIVGIGATGIYTRRGFEIAKKDGNLRASGVGPMLWVKLAPRNNVSVARVFCRTDLTIPESSDINTSLGMDGPDMTRDQVEFNHNFTSDALVMYGFRLGYHWDRSKQLQIEGQRRRFSNQGPYAEIVLTME